MTGSTTNDCRSPSWNTRWSAGSNTDSSHGVCPVLGLRSYRGKSLDDTSGIRNQGNDLLYPQNSYCVTCEYGPSAFDVRNRVVVSGLYELPVGKDKLLAINNRALEVLIGGWQIGGTFSHQTGQIATPQYGADNAGLGGPFGNFDRPNVTGISPFLPCNTSTVDSCANLAAYAKPGVVVTLNTATGPAPTNIGGLFGNASRGSFHGPV